MREAAKVLIPVGIIAVLVAMLLVYIFPVSCKSCSRALEGFQTLNTPITMCPENTRSFYDSKGNINCCEGDVEGTQCKGRVTCTFSSGATNIPFCNELSRRRKFIGEINPFVRKFLQSSPRTNFKTLLDGLKQINTSLQGLPDDKISMEDKKKLKALVDEEDLFFTNQSNDSTKLAIYEDETMYSIQYLENLFRNNPAVQNKDFIQQQTQKVMCTVQK